MNNVENVLINSKQDLYNYLNNFDWKAYRNTEMSDVYFLIEYDDYVEPLHFMSFENVWFESPCSLSQCFMKDEDVAEYVKEMYFEEAFEEALEYEKMFQIDGKHYEIFNPQCFPFLPEKCKIIKPMTEKECLDWLIEHCNKEKEN